MKSNVCCAPYYGQDIKSKHSITLQTPEIWASIIMVTKVGRDSAHITLEAQKDMQVVIQSVSCPIFAKVRICQQAVPHHTIETKGWREDV